MRVYYIIQLSSFSCRRARLLYSVFIYLFKFFFFFNVRRRTHLGLVRHDDDDCDDNNDFIIIIVVIIMTALTRDPRANINRAAVCLR